MLAVNVIVVNFMDVVMARRRTIDWPCEMTYCTDLIYTSGLSHFIWPMGRRGVFDVCETWCRDGEADVPLLADVHGRIPERMT